MKVKSLSRVRLSNPMDCSLPGSSIHGIFQARVLEWGAIAFSDSMYLNFIKKTIKSLYLSSKKNCAVLRHVQLSATPWTIACLSSPSVHGIFQNMGCHFLLQRIFPTQGWNPRLLHWQVDSLPLSHQGNPQKELLCNKSLDRTLLW